MSDEQTEPKPKATKAAKPKPAKPSKAKPAKDKKGKKNGKGKGADGGEAPAGAPTRVAPSVAGHPRAGAQVRRAKGWGGLASFLIAGYLSMQAGIPTYDVGLRALVAGAVGYLLAWACSVTVWRHLVLAELRAAHEPASGDAKGPDGEDGVGVPQPKRA